MARERGHVLEDDVEGPVKSDEIQEHERLESARVVRLVAGAEGCESRSDQ